MTRQQQQQQPAPETAVAVFDPAAAGRQLQREIEARKPQLAALLSVDLESERGRAMLDRFVTVGLHAATSNPDLLRCTTESLVESIRQSAILGLEPTGALGDGALVVYNESVQEERPTGNGRSIVVTRKVPTARFQPMYRGLLKLARRSDQITIIDSAVVYEGDAFALDLGLEPRVEHVPWPMSGEPERGGYRGAYAFAKLRTGEIVVEWMTYADIEAVRRTSKAKDNGPWVSFWAEMARKTVLRRLMKRLPLESAAEHAIRLDVEAEANAVDVASPESAVTASAPRARLLSRLGVPGADSGAGSDDTPLSVDPGASEDGADPTEGREEPETTDGEIREPEPDGDTEPCRKASPYGEGQSCRLPKGHGGPHQASEQETWL